MRAGLARVLLAISALFGGSESVLSPPPEHQALYEAGYAEMVPSINNNAVRD